MSKPKKEMSWTEIFLGLVDIAKFFIKRIPNLLKILMLEIYTFILSLYMRAIGGGEEVKRIEEECSKGMKKIDEEYEEEVKKIKKKYKKKKK